MSSSIWACRSFPLRRVNAIARLPDPVRLIGHQDVDGIRFRPRVAVEILELDASPGPDDLPQGLGERLGTGRVMGVISLQQEVRHEVDGDDRLAGTGTAL